MESGLDGRNNGGLALLLGDGRSVSMESGLDGRNNEELPQFSVLVDFAVSMESGLDGRNN